MPTIYSKNPSRNRKIAKVGPDGKTPAWPYIYATYRQVGATCHTRCGFHPDHDNARVHGERCYALKGRTAIHSKRATPDASDGETVYRWIQGLPDGCGVRLHVAGDFYGEGDVLDWEYFERVCDAFRDRPKVSGWVYTHAPFADFLRMQAAAPGNLAVNWSCDSLDEAQDAQRDGAVALTCVLSPEQATQRVRGLTVCPEQTSGIPCADCRLCWKADRKTIVGFIAH